MKQLTAENIAPLVEVHLRRYRGRLERARSGAPGYREGELLALVKLWEGIAAKGCAPQLLTREEVEEIQDAFEDEGD